jgi:Zn-dependent membrane protease YugP
MMGMQGAYFIGMVVMAISWFVSNKLKTKFKEYSQTPLVNGMSGKEIAERMLRDNGITDVQVIATSGQLSDHYNPVKKTVNLSEVVYDSRNAAAAAVSAHECGHALQHAQGYAWLRMRSSLVPIVSFSSKIVQWVLLGGILLVNQFPGLLFFGILLFAATTLFSIITLPVEYDASNRALRWIKENDIVTSSEYAMSNDALKWAARTYLVAAIGSLATLLYYIGIYTRRR